MSYQFGKAVDKAWTGLIDVSSDDIKVSLIDLADMPQVSGATNATPIVVTVASHGLTSGQRVLLNGIGGNTAANGEFLATVLDGNTFSLQNKLTGANVAGSGSYTSGGALVALDVLEFFDDLPTPVATSGNLGSKTMGVVAAGAFDAADPTINTVTGDTVEAVVTWKDTGTPATSPLICIGLGTFTPNGSNVQVQFNAGGIFSGA